jgi:hypothetical protein
VALPWEWRPEGWDSSPDEITMEPDYLEDEAVLDMPPDYLGDEEITMPVDDLSAYDNPPALEDYSALGAPPPQMDGVGQPLPDGSLRPLADIYADAGLPPPGPGSPPSPEAVQLAQPQLKDRPFGVTDGQVGPALPNREEQFLAQEPAPAQEPLVAEERFRGLPQIQQAQLVAAGVVPAGYLNANDPNDAETLQLAKNLTLSEAELAAQGVQIESQRQAEKDRRLGVAADEHKARIAKREARREQHFRDTRNEAERLLDDAKVQAATKVNPKRYYANASTGEKVLSFIAAALGGLLAPHNGGKNSALDMIARNIQEDIEAQKAELVNQSYSLQHRRGILKDMIDLYGDEDKAAAAAENQYYEAVKLGIAEKMQMYLPGGVTAQKAAELYKATEIQQHGRMLGWAERAAKIRGEAEERAEKARHQREQEKIGHINAQAARTQAGAAARNARVNEMETINKNAREWAMFPVKMIKEVAEAGKTQREALTAGKSLNLVDPSTGQTIAQLQPGKSGEHNAKFQDKVSQYSAWRQSVMAYTRAVAEAGRMVNLGKKLSSEERNRLETMAENLRAGPRRLETGAAFTEAEMKNWEQRFPSPQSLIDRSEPITKIHDLLSIKDNELQAEMVGNTGDKRGVDAYWKSVWNDDAAVAAGQENTATEDLASKARGNVTSPMVTVKRSWLVVSRPSTGWYSSRSVPHGPRERRPAPCSRTCLMIQTLTTT